MWSRVTGHVFKLIIEIGNLISFFVPSIISTSFPNVKVTQVQRVFFNDARGRDYLSDLRTDECASIEVQVDQKYYCLSAAAAVIKYMEFLNNAGRSR